MIKSMGKKWTLGKADGWHCFVLFEDGQLYVIGGRGHTIRSGDEPLDRGAGAGECSGHPQIFNRLAKKAKQERILIAGEVKLQGSDKSSVFYPRISLWNYKTGTYPRTCQYHVDALNQGPWWLREIFGATLAKNCVLYDPEDNKFVYPPLSIREAAAAEWNKIKGAAAGGVAGDRYALRLLEQWDESS